LLVACLTIAVGVVGLVHPDTLTALRRSYFATPGRLYVAGLVRLAMGLVLLLAAPAARRPIMLRLLGAMMCVQALSATVMGAERARVVLEWETTHTALLRVGAIVALVAGGLIAFAVTGRSSEVRNEVAP